MDETTKLEHLIVEQSFASPLGDDEYARVSSKLDDCLAQHGARWLRSYFSTDRRRLICEFEAPDAEAVRVSYRSAGLEFDRVWTADVHARESAQPVK